MGRLLIAIACTTALAAAAAPALARDSLGVFGQWGAFRDADVPRCYAIATGQGAASGAYATVSHWPQRQVRGQVHVRLSRSMGDDARVSLQAGGERFALSGAGRDAWAANAAMDEGILAAMRDAGTMTVTTRDRQGRQFSNSFSLDGAATAIDAATIGCTNY
jgi:hypothetical protein